MSKTIPESVLAAKTVADVLDAMAAIPVARRHELRGPLRKLLEERDTLHIAYRTDALADRGPRARVDVAAWFATWGLAELRKEAKRGLHPVLVEVIERLRPEWADEAASALVEGDPANLRIAQELVARGFSRKPESDAYPIALIASGAWLWGGDTPLVERLRAQLPAIEEDVFRIFEVEGGTQTSLASVDKYTGAAGRWSTALATLAREGRLSRDRLLDASLAALARDFAQFRAGWHNAFHELLQPTVPERIARRGAYLRLLHSTIPPTVTFALAALRAIDGAEPLDAGEILPALEPVVVGRVRGTAKDALDLAKVVGERDPAARPAVARLAASALAQENPALQKQAFDLLDAVGDTADAELREHVEGRADLVLPTLRKRLARWRDVPEEGKATSKDDAKGSNAAEREAPPEAEGELAGSPSFDPLEQSRRIEPLADFDALLERVLHVVEDDGDPDEVEQVLDGLSRLAAERPVDFAVRVGPVAKRADKRLARAQTSGWMAADLSRAVLVWCGRALEEAPEWARNRWETSVLSARIEALAERLAARQAHSTFAAPTHRGGWIDPVVLAERFVAAPPTAADELDVVCALLRLAPSRRAEAIVALGGLRGEPADALRHALGAEVKIGPTSSLWLAAARARDPRGDDVAVAARHPDAGPDGAVAARFAPTIQLTSKYRDKPYPELLVRRTPAPPKRIPLAHVAVLIHSGAGFGSAGTGWERSMVRWAATMWPAGSETFFASAIERLFENRSWSEPQWELAGQYERLLDPTLIWGPMAHLTLAVGLVAKEPGEAALANDAAIQGLASGRVDAAALGDAMALLRSKGDITMARWAKSLGSVAAESAAHRRAVVVAMQRALRGSVETSPRDEGAFVDLLRELCTDLGARITDPDAWAYLAASRHAKKVKDLAPQGRPGEEAS